jgi:hypothetical protein
MALPLIVAGLAARAVAGRVTKAVAKKSTQKTVVKKVKGRWHTKATKI